MTKEEISFLATLRNMLQAYIEKDEDNNRSYRQLAKRTKVAASTITRYAQGEVKSKPDAGNSFMILRELTGSSSKALQIMKPAYQDWYAGIGRLIRDDEEINTTMATLNLTRDHAKVLYKSYDNEGVSEAWIMKHYGETKGRELLDDLLLAEYICYNDAVNSYQGNEKKDSNINRTLAQGIALAANLKHDVEADVSFDLRNVAAFYYWFRANKEGYQEFKGYYEDFWSKVAGLEEKFKDLEIEKPYMIKVSSVRDVERGEG